MAKIRKNDEVVVIAGRHKGQIGRVLEVKSDKQLVKVDKIHIVKKHQKPTQNNTEGGIREKEAFFHISNVAIKDKSSKTNGVTKIGFKIENGKKVRFAKKTGKEL